MSQGRGDNRPMNAPAYLWRKGEKEWKTRVLTAPDGKRLATATTKSWWTTVMDVTLSDGRVLSMCRPSVWSYAVSVRDADGTEVGSYAAKWWSSEGLLKWKGRSYGWKNRGWWSGKRAWVDEQDREWMVFAPKWRWSGVDADVEALRSSPDDEALMTIGWYLLYLGMMDSNASAAT